MFSLSPKTRKHTLTEVQTPHRRPSAAAAQVGTGALHRRGKGNSEDAQREDLKIRTPVSPLAVTSKYNGGVRRGDIIIQQMLGREGTIL